MKPFYYLSIRTLVLSLVLMLMLFPVGLIVYAGKLLQGHEISNATSIAASTADRIHSDQTQLLSGLEQLVTTLSFFPAVQSRSKSASEHLLSVLVAANPKVSNILIADAGGSVWVSALPLTAEMSVAGSRFFRNAIASGTFSAGEYMIGGLQESPLFGFAFPVKKSSGVISDVIVVAVPLDMYSKLYQGEMASPVSSILLVDHKGTILYSSVNSGLVGKQDRQDLFAKMSAGHDGGTFEDAGNLGVRRLFSYRALRLKHETVPYMYIRTGLDKKYVLRSSYTQVGYMVAALSAILLVSFGLALYVSKKGIFGKLTQLHGAAAGRASQGILSAGQDIAERKSVEEALRASEQRFRSFVENANDVVFAMTVSGTFSYVSPQWKESTGYEPSEVIGKTFVPFVHPDDVPAWFAFLDLVLKTGKKQRGVEYRVLHKNGTWLWYTANGSRIMDQDGSVSFIGIGRDITEQKLVQNELMKTQRLESISVLAAGIAHNFNNVLTGVIGYISFARKHLKDYDKAAPLLEAAEKSSYRAASLARQLLTFSKGGVPFRTMASAEKLVQESLSLFLSGSSIKGVIDNRATQVISVDSEQINQAFNNIVLNSIHSMPHGGVLTVHIEDLRLEKNNVYLLNPGNYVKIAFEDSGRGIDKEHLHKVFDPYFSTRADGTGLGLSTTHSIVTKHGGHIDLVSEVNHGTTVVIMLPAYRDTPSVDPGETVEIEQNPVAVPLLIMDDEEDIRNLAFKCLSEMGYQVQTCCTGEEAVELYKNRWESGATLPVVMLDQLVPGGMGGEEAAKRILSIDPHARLIVSSGYADAPIMTECKNYGFCDTLSKPYNTDALVQVIQRVQKII